MKVISKKPNSYGIYRVGNAYKVVRNIREFNTVDEASLTATLLARGDITEEEVQHPDYKTDLNLVK